jgi:O-antigen/teichoic acid export membrane protein
MKNYFSLLISYILKGSIRTIKIKKNIIALTLLKGINVCIGFFLIPLTLGYLEPAKYGIWLTLSSIVSWVGYFDLGLSNGLRNKLGEAFATNDKKTARILVSTTFASLLIIVLVLNIFFWIINPFLNWTTILNVNSRITHETNILVIVVFTLFSFQFLTGLISAVIATDQRPALANSFSVLASLISLIVIYILTLFTNNSLLYLGISLSIISFIIPLIASIYFFKTKYNDISPMFSFVDFSKIKNIANQGIQFFILQITTLVLTMSDLLIISRLYGPKEVVPYNISYRLFGFVIILFGLFTTPFWAAYNEAYIKNDYSWIKRATNKLILFWGISVILVIILISISKYVFKFWIGNKVVIPNSLSLFMGIFVLLQTLNSIFATFIYSTGKLVILTYTAILLSIINIPLCIFFAKNLNLGTLGIILATIVCTLFNLVIAFLQYFKIINRKATGIWIK